MLASSEDIVAALSSLQEDMHIMREEQMHMVSSYDAMRAKYEHELANLQQLRADQHSQHKLLSQAVSRFAEILETAELARGPYVEDVPGNGEQDDTLSRDVRQQVDMLRRLEARARALVKVESGQLPALRVAMETAERRAVEMERETAARLQTLERVRECDAQQERDRLQKALEESTEEVKRVLEDKNRIEERHALAEEMIQSELTHLRVQLDETEECMQCLQAANIAAKERASTEREEENVEWEKEKAKWADELQRIGLALQIMEKKKEEECARAEQMVAQREREKEEWVRKTERLTVNLSTLEAQSNLERENAQNIIDTKDKVIGSLNEAMVGEDQKLWVKGGCNF